MKCTSEALCLRQISTCRLRRYYGVLLLTSTLLGTLILTGCVSQPKPPHEPPPPTAPMPAGNPEVTIQGKSQQQITAEVRKFFLGRGYQERATEHPSKLIFDRPQVNETPGRFPDTALRVRLTLQPLPNRGVKLSAYSYRIQRWKEAQEEENPMDSALPQIQALLNQINANLNSAR